MKKAVLIDVSAVMYKAYYSLINMRNSNGEPTGAAYGFTNTLLSIIDKFKPDYIAACFDVRREQLKRREMYEGYKKQRKAAPEELIAQISKIEEILDGFNIKKFKVIGYEADDLLGTLSKNLAENNIKTYIVTGDKDLSQLLSENRKISLLGKGVGKFRVLETDDDVVEQLGVLPSQIPDLFGLQGDSSDGIPGVRGVGPKTAVKFISEYGDLETLYENIDKTKGKMREKLEQDKELAFLSRKLAIIDENVPVEVDVEKLEFKKLDNDRLYKIFNELEFKSLLKKLKIEAGEATIEENKKEINNENLIEFKKEDIIIIDNNEKLRDIEFADEIALLFNGAGVAISSNEKLYYISLYHNYLGATNCDEMLLKEKIEKCNVIGYSLKNLIKKEYIKEKNYFDIMIAYYILDSDSKYDLENILNSKFGIQLANYKETFGKEVIEKIDINRATEFYCKRVLYFENLKKSFEEELKQEELYDLFINIELPLVKVLAKMEKYGIKIDIKYFEKYSKELYGKLVKLEEEIYEMANEEFNINSPKQLSEILFIKMGINPVKKTKTGFSTNVEVLETLKNRGIEIADKLLQYRQYKKLQTTYVEALPKLVDKNDRIHTTFNQTGTTTGRLSSVNPNLQNIPVKTSEGIKIRYGFLAEEGYSLVASDYSQVELRVLAELSKDKNLIEAYSKDLDLHDLTARKILGKDETEEITRAERGIAKIVNFSIIYGKTPFGLSKEIGITVGEAKTYIDKYFETYENVKKFIDDTVEFAKENGYVKTRFGRKRRIIGINSKNKNIKNQAERMAVNSVVQGTAADVLKIVMIKLYAELKDKKDIKMLLQVHDELVFSIENSKIEEYSKLIKDVMENSINFENIKLITNINSGKRWSETK
ncbi:DNA polymerase I [Haliovirga abyssi]|uniref:DNA polymerase I n=1 Tax=Haliovirga abyssi TaxID=2996794 RepID=A0AAU9DEY2_9FUSO|nr:DNA polymerase I [Haliovirga abyssi]BDU50753.1 DNA polymerase I [Haliovirga abyssi]